MNKTRENKLHCTALGTYKKWYELSEDTVSESVSLRLFCVRLIFLLGDKCMVFMLALGNSSAKENFSPITSETGEQLAGCYRISVSWRLPSISESPDAGMQFTFCCMLLW